tara:strand:+ start:39261 stop:40703 length:1443 start_codon:yes stop_codon:yes gene_type:complete
MSTHYIAQGKITSSKPKAYLSKNERQKIDRMLIQILQRHADDMITASLWEYSNQDQTSMRANIVQLQKFSRDDVDRELNCMAPQTATLLQKRNLDPHSFLMVYFKCLSKNIYIASGKYSMNTDFISNRKLIGQIYYDALACFNLGESNSSALESSASTRTWKNLSSQVSTKNVSTKHSTASHNLSPVDSSLNVSHSHISHSKTDITGGQSKQTGQISLPKPNNRSFAVTDSQMNQFNATLDRLRSTKGGITSVANRSYSSTLPIPHVTETNITPEDSVSCIQTKQPKQPKQTKQTKISNQQFKLHRRKKEPTMSSVMSRSEQSHRRIQHKRSQSHFQPPSMSVFSMISNKTLDNAGDVNQFAQSAAQSSILFSTLDDSVSKMNNNTKNDGHDDFEVFHDAQPRKSTADTINDDQSYEVDDLSNPEWESEDDEDDEDDDDDDDENEIVLDDEDEDRSDPKSITEVSQMTQINEQDEYSYTY